MAQKGISGVEIRQWINKFGKLMETSRINQVYRFGPSELCIHLFTKEGKKFVTFSVPSIIFITDNKPDKEAKETGFSSWMRNTLNGAIVSKVEQVNSERIIKFTLQKSEQYEMYIEMYSRGNIIICQNGKILISLEKQEMKDRVVAKGGEYVVPESFNTFSASSEDIAKLVQENIDNNSGLNASKFFATKLGLGGEYSRQVCEKIGIGLEDSLDKIDSRKVVESITEIISRDVNFKYLEDNYYNITPKKDNNMLKKIEKIKVILEEQKKTLARVEIDAEENNAIGNVIYENYGFFEDLRKAHEYAEENGKNLNDAIDKLKKKHGFIGNIKFEKPFVEVEIDTKQ